MPTLPPRHCPRHGSRFTGPRCPTCTRERRQAVDARRGSASERGYGWEWAEIRAEHLRQQPSCQAPGCGTKATDVDHRLPRRQGGTDEAMNLVSLCHADHSAKTARDDGGFGNRRSA